MGTLTWVDNCLEQRSSLIIAVMLLALLLLYAAFSAGSIPLGGTDAGWYISTAEKILKGQDNFLELMFHKGFPLLLAPVIYLWGYDFLAMHILIIVFALGSIGLCYLLLKDMEHKRLILLIVFLTGIHPTFVDSTRFILTEMPRFFFILAGLIATEKYVSDERVFSRWLIIASFSLCASYLIKHSGAVLIAAAVLRLLFVDYRKALLLGLLPAILIAISASSVFDFTVYYVIERQYWRIGDRSTSWKFFLDVLKGFPLRFVCASDLIFYHLPALLKEKLHLWASLSSLIILCPVLIGWIRCWLKQRTVIEFYVPLYFGILVIYPLPWPRYWIYIIPFLLLYFFTGTIVIFEWINQFARTARRYKTVLLMTLAILIILFSTVGNIKTYAELQEHPISPEWSEFMESCAWIKQNTPRNSHVMGYYSHWIKILSDRTGYPISQTVEPVNQMQWFEEQKLNYVILQDRPHCDLEYIVPVLHRYPTMFRLVYQSGHTKLYKVVRPGS